jgi:hypothetical protein
LILLSNTEEEDRLGKTLTSRIHGFKLASIKMSKP